MKQVFNLSTKRLTEFVKGDTIYCRYKKDKGSNPLFLCEFISYDKSKAVVTARILQHYEWKAGYKQDEIITAKYHECALYGNATNEEGHSYYRFFDHSLYAMHPMEVHKVIENDVHVSEHPSYAVARFSRINGGHRALFGSSIQNHQTITLTVSRASHHRSLGNDQYFGKSEVIEVEMSETQFSQLITSFNMGSGVPVTIKRLKGEMYPNPPFQAKADLFVSEFKKRLHNYSIEVKSIIEKTTDILKNKNNIGKGDRETMLKELETLTTELASSIPFYHEQFMEATEQTLLEAMTEMESIANRIIQDRGMEALGITKENLLPRLSSSNE